MSNPLDLIENLFNVDLQGKIDGMISKAQAKGPVRRERGALPETAIGPMVTPNSVGLYPTQEWLPITVDGGGGSTLVNFSLLDPIGGRLSNHFWIEETGIYPKKPRGSFHIVSSMIVGISFNTATPSGALIASGGICLRTRNSPNDPNEGDPAIIGQSVLLNDVAFTSVGDLVTVTVYMSSFSTVPVIPYRGQGKDLGFGFVVGCSGLPEDATNVAMYAGATAGWPGTSGMVVTAVGVTP